MKTFSYDIMRNTSSRRGHSKMPVSNSHFALSSTSLGCMEPMKRVAKLLCCIFAMLVLTSLSVCYGQDTSGMAGEVTDSSGAAIPGATVTLKNGATGAQYTATTNSVGEYRFSAIPPGQGYEASFAATGFSAVTVNRHLPDRCHNPHAECNLPVGTQPRR